MNLPYMRATSPAAAMLKQRVNQLASVFNF